MDKDKDYSKVFKYFREMDVKPNEVLAIVKKSIEFNPNNRSSVWKMQRFQLYLWARLKEEKDGYLSKKTDTIRRLVRSEKYKKYYYKFFTYKSPKGSSIDSKWGDERLFELEFYRLNHLITDPRQSVFFINKRQKYFFVYEKFNKPIPQEVIDRIK